MLDDHQKPSIPFQRLIRYFGRYGTAVLRLLPPELAHDIGIWMLEKGVLDKIPLPSSTEWMTGLATNIPGIGQLPHPIGLAAGFDKNARAPGGFARMGFSFLELGTVTPNPQPGNPKPRMFRYPEQLTLINRMGFNSEGAQVVAGRLKELDWDHSRVPLGINLGKNKSTPNDEALSDYLDGLKSFLPYGDYFVINISSPNTEGLRNLAEEEFLDILAKEVPGSLSKIWVKLDPDTPKDQFQKIVACLMRNQYQGIILCNTHRVDWPQTGGLSGHPLTSISQSRLEWAYEVHQGKMFMIASGGIFSGLDVIERIRRGAHAVQLYSALVYRGPFAVLEILEELSAELKLRGVSCLSDIRGTHYQ